MNIPPEKPRRSSFNDNYSHLAGTDPMPPIRNIALVVFVAAVLLTVAGWGALALLLKVTVDLASEQVSECAELCAPNKPILGGLSGCYYKAQDGTEVHCGSRQEQASECVKFCAPQDGLVESNICYCKETS